VLTTRSITNTVLQSPGEALPIPEAGEQVLDGTGTEGGRGTIEGFESEWPEETDESQVRTGAARRDRRFIMFRLFDREELELPEVEPEEIEKRRAVAVPRGLRRLFFTKIPRRVGTKEAAVEAGEEDVEETAMSFQGEAYTEDDQPRSRRRQRAEEEPGDEEFDFGEMESLQEYAEEEQPREGLFSGFIAFFRDMFGGPLGEAGTEEMEGGDLLIGEGLPGTGETAGRAAADGAEGGEAAGDTEPTAAPVVQPERMESKPSSFVETPVYSEEEQRQLDLMPPVAAPALSSSETFNCEKLWSYPETPQPQVPILRSGTVGRMNDDRYIDGVFGTGTNELVAVDGRNGIEIFRRELEAPFLEPVVSDVTGDGNGDLVVIFEDGQIHTFTEGLEPIWRYQGGGRIIALPVFTDLNGDRIDDLVFGTLEMDVIALDGSTGFELWRFFDAESEIVTSPVSLHLNNDRIRDVVFSTRKGTLYGLDGENGWGLWRNSLTSRLAGPPSIADLNDDGERDIVVLTRDGTLAAYGRDGRVLFSWQTDGSYAVPPTVGDIDGDGRNDIVLADTEGRVRVVEGHTRREMWSTNPQEGPITGRIVLVDLEGDGIMEIVLPCLSGALLVLAGESGEVRALFNGGGRIWSTPVVRDLNRDRIKEILIGTEAGQVFAVQVEGSRRGWLSFRKSSWIAANHDVQNTGYGQSRLLFLPWN
jgi:outer membrane protein assembly factor BamB